MNSNKGCNIWYILIGLLFLISGMIQSNNIYAIIIAALLLISIIGAFIYLTITGHKKIDQKDFYISEQKESEDINITESDKQACLLFFSNFNPTEGYTNEQINYNIWLAKKNVFFNEDTSIIEKGNILRGALMLYNKNILSSSDKYFLSNFIQALIIKFFPDKISTLIESRIIDDMDEIKDFYFINKIKESANIDKALIFETAKIYINHFAISSFERDIKTYFISVLNIPEQKHTQNYDKDYNIKLGYFIEKAFNDSKSSVTIYTTTQTVHSYLEAIKDICKKINDDFKYLGRFNNALALAYLPHYIDIRDDKKCIHFNKEIERLFNISDYPTLNIDKIVKIFNFSQTLNEPTLEEIQNPFIKILSRLGYGIIPENFTCENNCVLYRRKQAVYINKDIEDFCLLSILINKLIQADFATDADFCLFDKIISSLIDNVDERNYLSAFNRWQNTKKVILYKSRKDNIQELSNERKKMFGEILFRFTYSTGEVRPKRTSAIVDLLLLLGLEDNNIHGKIHNLITNSESSINDFKNVNKSINNKEKAQININKIRLKELEEETLLSQNILDDIFSQKEEIITNEMKEPAIVLNYKILEILSTLLSKEMWSKKEVDDLCKQKGLITSSVLEKINDYSYSKIEDSIIEDNGDDIFVIQDYKELLL